MLRAEDATDDFAALSHIRERAASMYASFPYTLAVGSTEIPYLVIQTAFFVPVSYFMIGFHRDAASFFFYCLVFLSTIAMFTWMGQLLVFLTPTQATAAILGSGQPWQMP